MNHPSRATSRQGVDRPGLRCPDRRQGHCPQGDPGVTPVGRAPRPRIRPAGCVSSREITRAFGPGSPPMSRVFLAALLITLAARTGAVARDDETRWVGTWAASPQLTEPANMPPEPGLADATLRQVVHVSLGGKRLRV